MGLKNIKKGPIQEAQHSNNTSSRKNSENPRAEIYDFKDYRGVPRVGTASWTKEDPPSKARTMLEAEIRF